MAQHRARIVVIVLFMVAFGVVGVASTATPQENSVGAESKQVFDYEKGKLALSIGSFMAVIGLVFKLGMEIKAAQDHMKDTNIHMTDAYKKEIENKISGLRKESDCGELHKAWSEMQAANKSELEEIKKHQTAIMETLARVDERTKSIVR